ncbi:YbbR-like domain-containing protein [Pendulispora albinea]|uniref:YbbR-like domain-containing protein n=1 Tax=Pendulispora albinea TaxID=2741071 RepID=A0ABZ2M1H4_9BACT
MALDIGEKVKAAFTENLNLKFIAFALSLVLYSLFHGAQDAQRTMSVNLVALMPPESASRVLVSPLPQSVHLVLRGSRSALDDLHSDEIGYLQIDIHLGSERRVTLDPSMVHVPPSVRVEQIDPPTIDLVWEDQVVRDVPIQVSVVGTPAPGYVVKGVPVAEPPTMRVRGPKSEVLVLQHVRADPFDVSGLTEGSFRRHLAIDRPTGRVQPELAAPSVLVTAEITREVVERPFIKIPVAVVGQAKGKSQPTEVDVRLVCPPEILRALRPEQVVPKATVHSSAPNGSESIAVEVNVEGCEAHTTPNAVVVRW